MRLPAIGAAAALMVCSLPAMAAPWDKPGWAITFHDEFDTGSVDPAKWVKRYKWGEAVINQELQAYVDDAFAFDGDVLRIVGKHEAGDYAGQTMEYTSGVISSVHEQTYGYFEIRCRMPAGQGLWPAFWLLGAVGTQGVNEIDIHEFLGHEPDTMYMTIHWGTSYDQGHESSGEQFTGEDFSQDYHTFAVDWDAQRVVWYVDGVERFQHAGAGVPHVNMYVITNLAIGGGWPGAPDLTTPFPAYYDVDYIRVYERSAGVDAGVGDASAADTGDLPDATIPPDDASSLDGSAGDGGADALAADAGGIDASGIDASGIDASGIDASGIDASGSDASADAASSAGAGPAEEGDSCACRAASPDGPAQGRAWQLWVLGAVLVARRRQRAVARAVNPCGTWR